MDLYNFISLIVIPLTIIHFALDYLPDRDVTHSETKIGIIQLFHHLISVIQTSGLFIVPFLNVNKSVFILLVTVSLISHMGYLKNEGRCWLLRFTNRIINPKTPDRKWISNIYSYIKHYIRGESWAYSDIRSDNNFGNSRLISCSLLISMVKYIILNPI
jgi:hypothetical protein